METMMTFICMSMMFIGLGILAVKILRVAFSITLAVLVILLLS